MNYQKRVALLVLLDSLIVIFSIYASFVMIYPDQNIFTDKLLLISAIILLLCYHFFAFFYQLYHKIWEYASVGEVVAIINAVTLMIIVTAFMQFIISQTVYVRVLAITWMFHIILIGGSRFSWRLSRNRLIKSNDHNKRALIVGADRKSVV